jgi:mono/diheme cytochrome c family protein
VPRNISPAPALISPTARAFATACLAAGLAFQAGAAEVNPALAGAEASFQNDIRPFLTKNCFECHGNGKAKGDFSLDPFKDAKSLHKAPMAWDNVLEMLRKRAMPPEDEPQPTQPEVDKVMQAVEGVRTTLEANTPPNVGRVTTRRLNKTEYNNTIRDLLGVDFKPAEDFPADDVGYGFDNIGDVLSVSPLLLEKYLAATESILDQAILVAQPPKPVKAVVGARRLPATLAAGEAGGLAAFEEGDYVIRAQLGIKAPAKGTLRAMLRIDGKDVKEFAVKPAAAANESTRFETTVRMPAATQRVTIALLNPAKATPANADAGGLLVQSLEIEGPFNPAPPKYPAVHTRLLAHKPGLAPREAAKEIVARFAAKAFRRPLRAGEVDKPLAFFDASQQRGEQFELGIKAALYRVLMSPDFLFRIEMDPPGAKPDQAYTINEHELASRLSYFLWNSMPDDELMALAGKGQLRGNLAKQVARMVKDPKSDSFLQNFTEQWLTLRKLDLVSPDPGLFPAFDANLKEAMIRESTMFFAAIAREDRSVLQLLDANFTFVNEPLAKLYGIEGVSGESFVRVKTPANRGGVLTMASLLALNSNATRTSPVKRGKFILEEILNAPPPPPPPDVPALEEGKQLTGTLRQVMEQHREKPMCASCHAKMDPLGFAFENFDAIGAWREKDAGGFPIDPSGVLPDGKTFHGAPGLKAVLESKKELFLRSISHKMLTYALGRGVEYYDRPTIEQIVTALSKTDHRFSTLLLEIVQSDPFQKRTIIAEETP